MITRAEFETEKAALLEAVARLLGEQQREIEALSQQVNRLERALRQQAEQQGEQLHEGEPRRRAA